MVITTRRRRALATILALVLAAESVSVVAAAAQVSPASHGAPGAVGAVVLPASSPDGDVLAEATADGSVPGSTARRPVALDRSVSPPAPSSQSAPPPAATMIAPAKIAPAAAKQAPTTSSATHSTATAFAGRNRVWIPALGTNRSVSPFACDRQRPPDNLVYRWGCAGTNNVYLLGHAYSVFKPLHDAYDHHRLKVGMKAYYADAAGTVHVYAVTWWRVTLPTPASKWAWAPQSKPSMTLQTCVGPNGRYRLMVRLVEVRG